MFTQITYMYISDLLVHSYSYVFCFVFNNDHFLMTEFHIHIVPQFYKYNVHVQCINSEIQGFQGSYRKTAPINNPCLQHRQMHYTRTCYVNKSYPILTHSWHYD